MKQSAGRPRNPRFICFWIVIVVLVAGFSATAVLSQTEEYVVLGWSDLGMSSFNPSFGSFAIFPPYNTLEAQVIRKDPSGPKLVTKGVTLNYDIPGNTSSAGKTDFWTHAGSLFGQQPSPDVGLTGNGLSGQLKAGRNADRFEALGIPLTPYADNDWGEAKPYQSARLRLFDSSGRVLGGTSTTMAVSDEMGCTSMGCHASEASILSRHPAVDGLDATKPVLCAGCHQSNALGTRGISGAKSLSERIHASHAGKTNDCYRCHPGANARGMRDVMHTTTNMSCQDCHGNTANVAKTIKAGRKPWFDEPDCGTCHGSRYAVEEGKLFRNSKGHAGLYCSACHGSPHAILPSREESDNAQSVKLQGKAGTLECKVCHSTTPKGAGPHGVGGAGAKGMNGQGGQGASVCARCHSDGRSGPVPPGHPSVDAGSKPNAKPVSAAAGGAGSQGGNAAVCARCHNDGRSGSPPPAHPSIAGLSGGSRAAASASTAKSGTGMKSGGSNAAVCSRCHADGRSGPTPAGHPGITGINSSGTTPVNPGSGGGTVSCAKCHSDGRTGPLPVGHPKVSGAKPGTSPQAVAGKNVKKPAGTAKSAVGAKPSAGAAKPPVKAAAGARGGSSCSRCHSDGRSGATPPGHPKV